MTRQITMLGNYLSVYIGRYIYIYIYTCTFCIFAKASA